MAINTYRQYGTQKSILLFFKMAKQGAKCKIYILLELANFILNSFQYGNNEKRLFMTSCSVIGFAALPSYL
jgi:hypothetical protein